MKVVFTQDQLAFLRENTARLSRIAEKDKNGDPYYARIIKTLSQKFIGNDTAVFIPLNRNEVRSIQALCQSSMKALDQAIEVYRDRGSASDSYKEAAEKKKAFVAELEAHVGRYL